MSSDRRHIEDLEILAGTRAKGPSRRRQAVRIEDLAGILDLPDTLQSTTVGAAPTAAQHNALVQDLHTIHQRLTALSQALTAKLT